MFKHSSNKVLHAALNLFPGSSRQHMIRAQGASTGSKTENALSLETASPQECEK